MTKRGVLVWKMSDEVYRAKIGGIRSQFSHHVRVDIERTRNKKGEKIVEIWSEYPEIVKEAIEKVVGAKAKLPKKKKKSSKNPKKKKR